MPGAGDADELRAQAQVLVWPQRAALLGMQERVHTLGEVARSQSGERGLCHGDLIGDNLLADRDGRLWVVDWDAAALAPRERDLALFAGQGFERFLDHYERDDGSCDLEPDLVAFFPLRRNLDDLIDWLGGGHDPLRRHRGKQDPGDAGLPQPDARPSQPKCQDEQGDAAGCPGQADAGHDQHPGGGQHPGWAPCCQPAPSCQCEESGIGRAPPRASSPATVQRRVGALGPRF